MTRTKAQSRRVAPRKRRVVRKLTEKAEIASRVLAGEDQTELAFDYNIHAETVRKFHRYAPKVNQFLAQCPDKDRKYQRTGKFHELEQKLNSWILEQQAEGESLTDNIVQTKARQFHEELELTDPFSASRGWLGKFKKRFGNFSTNVGETTGAPDEAAALEFILELEDLIEEGGYELENIYSMNETGICWRALPKKTLIEAGEKHSQGSKSRARITAAMCSNATATHQLPLLVIGKSEQPKCFKHVENLTVDYRAQKNACITRRLFTDWVLNCFKPRVETHQKRINRKGKVLLLVDNSDAHQLVPVAGLGGNITIKSLPPETASLIHPQEQGIIIETKRLFQRRMLRCLSLCRGGVKEFYETYDLLDAVRMLSGSWKKLTSVHLANAWRPLLPNRIANREDESQQLQGHEATMTTLLQAVTDGITEQDVRDWLEELNAEEEQVECPWEQSSAGSDLEGNVDDPDELNAEGGQGECPWEQSSAGSDLEGDVDDPDEDAIAQAFQVLLPWVRKLPAHVQAHPIERLYEYYSNDKLNK